MSLSEMLKERKYQEIWDQYCSFLDLIHRRLHENTAPADGRADTAVVKL